MQVDQRIQVAELHVAQQRGADHTGVVHDGGDLVPLHHGLHGLGGGGTVGQVDLDTVQPGVVDLGAPPRQRDDFVALLQQLFADDLSDAGAAARHRRNLVGFHVLPSTSASTRSGLPLPFSIFSGAATTSAPVGGS
ncbi:hypothetical protein SDC9_146723 [bioreactor metagenome]|uniref:Uncharacterized protein n=1 Tax=bioreactor metagenome TaxID=1076179 RepID=A0A645EE29_9ZZZZ